MSDYWESRFADEDATHEHQRRSEREARVFLDVVKRAREHPGNPGGQFNTALRAAHSVIEIGCGTGELTDLIRYRYGTAVTYATDPTLDAVRLAQRLHPKTRYEQFDIARDWPTHLGNFAVAVALNVLEHYGNRVAIAERMLGLADRAIVVVPYRRPLSKKSFAEFRIVDSFTYERDTHRGSSRGSAVRQLALLLEPKRR